MKLSNIHMRLDLTVFLFIASPMPGSRLYAECKRKGYLTKEDLKFDVKHAEIEIPEDSPEYIMSKEELEKLADDKTREFNEIIKQKKSRSLGNQVQSVLEKAWR